MSSNTLPGSSAAVVAAVNPVMASADCEKHSFSFFFFFFLGTRTISCAPELPYATSRLRGVEISCFTHTHTHTHTHIDMTHSHNNPQPHTSHHIRSRHVTGNSCIQSSADGSAPARLSHRRESCSWSHRLPSLLKICPATKCHLREDGNEARILLIILP